ncbi:hypothetical protein HNP93_000706 [Methanococcus maripaludis]|uniref:Uncharacterized protein n=1 Tax=Methanococcus maripaludis TaxID=39152 RepID=A0A7J9P469_METMI|nr:hypothetical protein [Methanococcus maripaludis]MBA2858005.1 hypothetical protein [Methanococcus maripaludis]
MEFKKNLTDFLSIIKENWFFAILSLILAIFSFFHMETILNDIWAILGIYATILSIIISATYISAQVAISAFGTRIWKNYANDRYIGFYVYLFPLIFILGAILAIINFGYPVLSLNINNLFIMEFIEKNIIDYGLFGLFLGIFTFFITFSLFNIPNYLKHIMTILNPKNIVIDALKQIFNSKKYGEYEKKLLMDIEDVFKELHRKEQYDTILDCLKLLYGEEFKTRFGANLDNLNGFPDDYSALIKKICFMNYPEKYEEDIKVSAIEGLETISKELIAHNQNSYYQIIRIHEIMQDTIEKYDPNRSLIDVRDYYSEIILQYVTLQFIRSFKSIKVELLKNDKFGNLKSIFMDSMSISRTLIFKWVNFYHKLDNLSQFQIHHTKSRWIDSIMEMINEDTFEIIEESKNENEVVYLIEYLLDFYREIIITKDFDYKIGLNYLFEKEHKIITNSFTRLIDLLESKNYIQSLTSVLDSIHFLNKNDLFDEYFKKWANEKKYGEKLEKIKNKSPKSK